MSHTKYRVDSKDSGPFIISNSKENPEDENQEKIVEEVHANVKGELSWAAKLAYGSLGLPYSMQLSIIAFYINYFLLDVAKISPIYNAVILFTSRIIDGLTDPIGGYIFNRVSFRWGKMKPWILFSSPLVALCYFALWCLPDISPVGQLIYYLFAHSLLWTFMTATRIPHTALTVYMTLNQNERDQLTKYRTLFEAAGLLLSIFFHWGVTVLFKVSTQNTLACEQNFTNSTPDLLREHSIEHNEQFRTEFLRASLNIPSNVSGAYMTSAGIVALICIASALFVFFTVQEVVDVIPTSKTSFIKGSKMIIRYKPFVILTMATVASILATQSIQSVLELYLTHVKRKKEQFIYLAASLIISTIILLFVWALIMKKIGKKKSFLIGNLCLIPTIVVVIVSESPMYLLYIAAVIGANTVACGYVMPWAMLPECIDGFMLETGRRPVEIFYTFFFLGAKLVQALYAGVVQLALGASGFDASKCVQPESVTLTLRLLMGAIPGCVLVISTICLYFYSIDDNRAKEIQIQLKELRNSTTKHTKLDEDSLDENDIDDTFF